MIKITNKNNCCGCGACLNVCPKQCISYKEDEEGFLYPTVNANDCIDCNLCNKVCPYNSETVPRKPIDIYAAKNKDEQIRLNSSSGGFFSALAEYVINQEGIVFGAQFDKNWNVIHSYTNNKKGISQYRGSKYVQSNTLHTYQEAKSFLEKDILVLYTGTPCQILGLKKFLRKDYSNLITVDFVCHGVPSPKIWQLYIKNLSLDAPINYISFRDKQKGWRNFTLSIQTQFSNLKFNTNENQSPYMKGFLNELYLRPSCHNCIAKNFSSNSDLTIADYWWIQNIKPEFDDDKGVSLVYVNTTKGNHILQELNIDKFETNSEKDISSAYLYQGAVTQSAIPNPHRKQFFSLVTSTNMNHLILDFTKPSLPQRIKLLGKKFLRKSRFLNSLYKNHIKPNIKK